MVCELKKFNFLTLHTFSSCRLTRDQQIAGNADGVQADVYKRQPFPPAFFSVSIVHIFSTSVPKKTFFPFSPELGLLGLADIRHLVWLKFFSFYLFLIIFIFLYSFITL